MNSKPYILFDAGGTLVFPDQDFLIETAKNCGISLTHKQLFDGYHRLIYRLDWQVYNAGIPPRDPWPNGYVAALFEYGLNIHRTNIDVLTKLVNIRHKKKSLWTFTFPWIREILVFLKAEGYRMSVVSNSDGGVKKVFQDLDLSQYFEYIFASQDFRIEKPDPKIFKAAINTIEIDPADVIFVGDIFNVDVKGANLAGIGAIHLDPLQLYNDISGIHLSRITELKTFLASYFASPQSFRPKLFPFIGNKINFFAGGHQSHEDNDCAFPSHYLENLTSLAT
jgi:putative hydrolase of the HAD superfamily